MATRVSSPELIGRAEELRVLEAAFDGAAAGRPGVVAIAGESGVGKSRLVAELPELQRDANTLVLTGHCVELSEGEIPFAPVVAALRRLARDLEPDAVDEIFGSATGELTRLFPDLARAAVPGPESLGLGAVGQARLFEFLLAIFQRLAAEQPTAIVIEDLHWADRSTRDLLMFLTRSLRDERLLLVVTYRSDELHRRHPMRPFLAQLATAPLVEHLELRPLTRAEAGRQLDHILGTRADASLVEAVYARSEGNPLFTEELVCARSSDSALPATLRDALLLRVEDLPRNSQEVVRVAAAAGRCAQHRLLEAVLDMPERELFEAIREAVNRHVLVESDDDRSYEFRHALLREAIYGDLLPGERVKLHVDIAEAIEADPSLADVQVTVAAELAAHWYAAHELDCALRTSIDAGFESEQIYAFAEAQRQFERALELWGKVTQEQRVDRHEILRHAAESAHHAGEPERAVALGRLLVDELDAARDPEATAFALERLGRYLWTTGRGDEALTVYRRAVAILPPEPSVALAKALAAEGQILMLLDRPLEGAALCDRALPVAQAAGARVVELNILNTLIAARGALQNDTAGAVEMMDAARTLAEELDEPEELLRSYMNGSDALDQGGRVEEALQVALEGAETAARLGLERHMGLFLIAEAAARLVRLGRWDEATDLGERVMASGTSSLSVVSGHAACAAVAIERGDLTLARSLLEKGQQVLARNSGSMWLAEVNTPLALLALRDGRARDAYALVVDSLERLAGGEYVFYTAQLYWIGVAAEADAAELARPLRDDDALAESERRARSLLERMDTLIAAYSEHPAPPRLLAWRSMAQAELGRLRGDAEPADWADAAGRFLALGQIGDAAHARYRQAEVMAGDRAAREETVAVLAESRATAERLAMAPLLSRIDSLARRARIKFDAQAEPDDVGAPLDAAAQVGLTDRELEVLELVAQGHTNKEIGTLLYMSEKTASVHVSRILSKLSASNRAEAAASAERLGLVGAP